MNYLEFEKPLANIKSQIKKLEQAAAAEGCKPNEAEIQNLQNEYNSKLIEIYNNLTPWHKTQLARHQDRPRFLSYAKELLTDITDLAGDRYYGNDEAIQAGLARFRGQAIAFVGQEKGTDTKSRIKHNFGSPLPEGYRKAQRIMKLANHFGIPLITFIDTSGAYPGVAAEERGQSEAIASSIYTALDLEIPMISIVIGEGGSGGALAIAAANKVYMLEHAIYSVISPEGAASILWRDSSRALDAATNMKITAQDLYKLKIIDGIIKEPQGGAQRDPLATIRATGEKIDIALKELINKKGAILKKERYEKYLAIGRHLS